MSKNNHGQPITDSGHVIPMNELIYKDLDKLFGRKLTRAELKQATDYVMNESNNEYYRGIQIGLNLNDKDRQARLEARLEAQNGGTEWMTWIKS